MFGSLKSKAGFYTGSLAGPCHDSLIVALILGETLEKGCCQEDCKRGSSI